MGQNQGKLVSEYYIFGTWQLSQDFKKLTEIEIGKLISCALERGIKRFDTARVYGHGQVEKILGRHLSSSSRVITKIPGKRLEDPYTKEISVFYDEKKILENLDLSVSSLNFLPEAILLHNWDKRWAICQQIDLIGYTKEAAKKYNIPKVGISLPNSYKQPLSKEVLELVDLIQLPLNSEEDDWVNQDYIQKIKNFSVEVVIRSLFRQGVAVRSLTERKSFGVGDPRQVYATTYPNLHPVDPDIVIRQTLNNFNSPLVIGASSEAQITNNVISISG